MVEKKTPTAGGIATRRDEKPVDGAIPGSRAEFCRIYDKVRKVTADPSPALKRPVLRSRAVSSPNPVMLITKESGVPWTPRAKRKPSGREITVTSAGAKKPGVTGRLWWGLAGTEVWGCFLPTESTIEHAGQSFGRGSSSRSTYSNQSNESRSCLSRTY